MNKLIINQGVLMRTTITQVRRHIDDIKVYKFLKINYKDDKKIRKVKNTVNKYMADIRPDRLTTC
jgi:hypothetical protein